MSDDTERFNVTVTTDETRHGVGLLFEWKVHFDADGGYRQTDLTARTPHGTSIGSNNALAIEDLPDGVRDEIIDTLRFAAEEVDPGGRE